MFNKDYFEKVFQKADPWEYGRSGYERANHRRQLEAVKLLYPQPGQFLEIGCAEGVFTALLANAFPQASVLGIDLSRVAVARAKELEQLKYPYAPLLYKEAAAG
ncbi:MAG: methyltransferase domain-containing protein [Chloroflexota bacterium]